MKICFVASEVAPLAKTGGLADVAGALPRYLRKQGHDIRLFMPLYSSIGLSGLGAAHVDVAQDVPIQLGTHYYRFSLLEAQLPNSNVPLYLVHCPAAFDRASLYTNSSDEHLRFLVLQRAALEACQRMGFAPDVIHCNDWHTALIPLLLRTAYSWDRLFQRSRTILSIHNIGYQGIFPSATMYDLGADVRTIVDPIVHSSGGMNWMREGVRLADRVTTVSPTYAREICAPVGGHGLDAVLRSRGDGVVGILNGVDYSEWSPQTDRYLKHRYSASDLSGKDATKRSFLDWLNLSVSPDTPVIGIVSRMTVQKGFDLLFDSLPDVLINRDVALVALGSGDALYENFFADLQRRFPDRAVFHRGYNDELSHLIEASSDMFLMPSQYEPCGLNQMYSLKYGTVPIVRKTGGLADSVQMWDPATRTGTGIVFDDFDSPAVRWALHTALDLYKNTEDWQQIIQNAMGQDFSWETQGAEYERLYEAVTSR